MSDHGPDWYKPPTEALPGPGPGSPGAGRWTVFGALSDGWEMLKGDLVGACGGVVLFLFVAMGLSFVSNAIALAVFPPAPGALPTDPNVAASGLSMALSLVPSAFLQAGLAKWLLGLVRRSPDRGVASLFTPAISSAFSVLVANVLLQVGLVVGFLALVVPGIILAMGWSFAALAIVDRGLGPLEGLGASWAMTRGHRLGLFGYFLLSCLVCFGGALLCLVGMIPAAAITYLGWASIYVRLRGEEPALPGREPAWPTA